MSRDLLKIAGAAAAIAIGTVTAAAAQPVPPITPMHTQLQLTRQADIAKARRILSTSPVERRAFLSNPQLYARQYGLLSLTATDLIQLKNDIRGFGEDSNPKEQNPPPPPKHTVGAPVGH